MERAKSNQVNFVVITGVVVDFGTYIYNSNSLAYRARIKLVSHKRYSYVDVYGFGRVATTMVLTCNVGNQVYIEGVLSNAEMQDANGDVVYAPYIRAEYTECLLRHKKMEMPKPNIIRLMDKLDPSRLVAEVYPNRKKKEKE